MTYRGDKATISNRTTKLINEQARIIDCLIMFQKIANVLSIISFLMVTSVIGGGYYGYKYVTSEQFKTKLMNQVLGGVEGLMPKVLDNALPNVTSGTIPQFSPPTSDLTR